MKWYTKWGIILFCSFFLAFFCVSYLGKLLNPILINYLNLEVERVTSNIIRTAVNDVLVTEEQSNLVKIVKNDKNEVEMVDYDTQKVNLLLKKVNTAVFKKLKKMEEGNIEDFPLSSSLLGGNYQDVKSGIVCEIPVGVFTNNGFLNNLGPIIPIKMSFLGQVNSNLRTKTTGYGINNLYLELTIQIEVKERISLPKSSKDVTISIEAPLSVKVISGVVPEYYGGVVDKTSPTFSFSAYES